MLPVPEMSDSSTGPMDVKSAMKEENQLCCSECDRMKCTNQFFERRTSKTLRTILLPLLSFKQSNSLSW